MRVILKSVALCLALAVLWCAIAVSQNDVDAQAPSAVVVENSDSSAIPSSTLVNEVYRVYYKARPASQWTLDRDGSGNVLEYGSRAAAQSRCDTLTAYGAGPPRGHWDARPARVQ